MSKDIVQSSIECLANMPIEDTSYQVARSVVLDEIDRLNKELEETKEILNIRACQLEDIRKQKTDYSEINVLEMKIERLNNIINEAREFIKEINNPNIVISRKEICKKLLEILDKGE